ncbi:MAG: hypothetical protein R2932_24785 [Caldilineaceae bacterium]
MKNSTKPSEKSTPDGIHATIAEGLKAQGLDSVQTATLDEPEHGLTEAKCFANTDVLSLRGHMAHGKVDDAIVDRAHQRVLDGMGLVVLHSAHFLQEIFRKLMGTTCGLRWRGRQRQRTHLG